MIVPTESSQERDILEKINKMAFLLLGDYHDAWDLTQEVFYELEKGRGKWEQAQSKVAWAVAVFHRQFKKFLRLRAKHKMVAFDGDKPVSRGISSEKKVILQEEVQKTFATLQELNKDIAEALLLFSVEQMSIKEIAQLQEVSEGTVKWRIFEARRMIAGRSQE